MLTTNSLRQATPTLCIRNTSEIFVNFGHETVHRQDSSLTYYICAEEFETSPTNFILRLILNVSRYMLYLCHVVVVQMVNRASADPERGGGDRGSGPPGKSQVIWVSLGNKELDKLDPLENV